MVYLHTFGLMDPEAGHMDEIMLEVGRLNDYIRQFCPEVKSIDASNFSDSPTIDDLQELVQSRIKAIDQSVVNKH